MENEKIKLFLSGEGSGYGFGDGSGHGSGYGFGYGDGSGRGSGYGDGEGFGFAYGSGYGEGSGHGSGSGDGDGFGSGYGSGSGSGYGYGEGSGHGSGSGDGDGLKQYKTKDESGISYEILGHKKDKKARIRKYKGKNVAYIDGVQTVIEKIKGNIALGFILNDDFSEEKTVVVKFKGFFAHGETVKEAKNSVQAKYFSSLDFENKKAEFKKKFSDKHKKYPAKDFYEWHFLITGSCQQGRLNFAKQKGIDIENDTLTLSEFFELSKSGWGWEQVEKLLN